MKKITILIIAISTLALSSCFKTDPTVYGCIDICFVNNSALVSDYGSTYHVMETSIEDWKYKNRIYISFDILETINNSEYNIRLNEYTEYVIKNALVKSTSSPDLQGEDAVYLNQGFFSGSIPYFNIQCVYARKKNSTSIHDVNLVYDDTLSDETNAVFHLTHNAFGDTYKEGVDVKDCESVAMCYTFPVSEFFHKGVGMVDITIDYYWYKENSTGTTTELQKFETSTSVNF